jgi:patatin-related protein
MDALMGAVSHPRVIRLGLVMNGGVSLAVWIGGVTRELDRLRIASVAVDREPAGLIPDADDPRRLSGTERLYARLLRILSQKVVIDVIAGASAGGINGILLAAAIANGKPLPDLRETWIGVGDFRGLLRPASQPNPPSLMQGDDVVLPEMQATLAELYQDARPSPQDYLYLYVSATDLRGYTRQFHDSTNRIFEEREHRRMLRFELAPPGGASSPGSAAAVFPWANALDLRSAPACRLLAEAARSTSSFPVAFEPHAAAFADENGESSNHWLIDGGVLDNQPFNPVLDRISVLPGGEPIKRVVAYIVPYVNEPDSFLEQGTPPTATEIMGATGSLPRDLPKLQGLDRVVSQAIVQARAEDDRRRAWNPARADEFAGVAESLFRLYRETRLDASYLLYAAWASPGFKPGDGVHGQDPAFGPQVALTRRVARTPGMDDSTGIPWVPEFRDWHEEPFWGWGFAVAERVAAWALLFLRDALSAVLLDAQPDSELVLDIVAARQRASQLVFDVRADKGRLVNRFRALPAVREAIERQQRELDRPEGDRRDVRPKDEKLREWALEVYSTNQVQAELALLKGDFGLLDKAIANVNERLGAVPPRPDVQQLLDLEVIRNATSIESADVPFPFEFLFMSAGVKNSLGHSAASPATKLVGIKASHFAGFLKRSWRANDWLWGRMDGVEHVLRSLLDADLVAGLSDAAIRKLACFSFPRDDSGTLLAETFGGTGCSVTAARKELVDTLLEAKHAFRKANPSPEMIRAGDLPGADAEDEYETARQALEHCRKALAARIQLAVLCDDAEELERIAKTVDEDVRGGASRVTSGVFWRGKLESSPSPLTVRDRVRLFRELDIADESPGEEASSRLVMDVGSHAIAVGAALIAGDRGGLPLAVRGALATLRGVTLSVSTVVRLLARQPWIGAAFVAVLIGLFVWGLVDGGVVIGTAAPILALAVVVGLVVLLTMATSVLEQPLWQAAPGEKTGGWKHALGFLVLLGIPLAFGVLFGWPGVGGLRDWLGGRADRGVVDVVAALALVAAALAVARLVLEHWRVHRIKPVRRSLSGYRIAAVAGVVALLGGFMVHRITDGSWHAWAEKHKGAILIAGFFLAATLAAIIVEIAFPFFDRRSARRSRAAAGSG